MNDLCTRFFEKKGLNNSKGTTADPSRAPEASIGGGTSETGDATIVPIVEGSMKEADMGWRMEGKPFGHDTSES